MPKNPKNTGGSKDFAAKQTMNPTKGGRRGGSQTREPEQQDAKRRIGQFGGEGEPPIMKK